VERLATAYRAALLVEAGEGGSLAPVMEYVALDLGEGYDDLIGL
jgi:hypothetical protein